MWSAKPNPPLPRLNTITEKLLIRVASCIMRREATVRIAHNSTFASHHFPFLCTSINLTTALQSHGQPPAQRRAAKTNEGTRCAASGLKEDRSLPQRSCKIIQTFITDSKKLQKHTHKKTISRGFLTNLGILNGASHANSNIQLVF